ncbi:hypothetical protein [Nostoc sp. PA-18-2419]|uniref:hypothetical protein n=1 Tax=Nostoc sp. PA-18-2419 TaxID=2575443 RepID=UPI001108A965|nr:hypothetical protein [Nostoc sp. PA-18-2419]
MATIKIFDLHPAGSELFLDSESYLNDLTDDELNSTQGGLSPLTISSWWCAGAIAYSVTYAWGRWGPK